MNKACCPNCGKELVNLEVDTEETGVSSFWCDDCNIDIAIDANKEDYEN